MRSTRPSGSPAPCSMGHGGLSRWASPSAQKSLAGSRPSSAGCRASRARSSRYLAFTVAALAFHLDVVGDSDKYTLPSGLPTPHFPAISLQAVREVLPGASPWPCWAASSRCCRPSWRTAWRGRATTPTPSSSRWASPTSRALLRRHPGHGGHRAHGHQHPLRRALAGRGHRARAHRARGRAGARAAIGLLPMAGLAALLLLVAWNIARPSTSRNRGCRAATPAFTCS